MNKYLWVLFFFLLAGFQAYSQNIKTLNGSVKDSLGTTLPGVNIQLVSSMDSLFTESDVNGDFHFNGVRSNQFTISYQIIGYQPLKRHYILSSTASLQKLGDIILSSRSTNLKGVNVVEIIPMKIKEDTVEYNAAAYKVRDNAPAEDAIKKLPGVDVDANGNITAQGKSVTKVRVNGKDFFGGDVQTATKNIPADMVQSYQIVDDYGDQANLTGIKTGEPEKILNINIKPSKNYGYFGQLTLADGQDDIPTIDGIRDKNRFITGLTLFKFKGNRQIALLGNLNNTNTNLFSFGGPPGGGRAFGGGGGGGGRGNGGSGSNANGITTARSIGTNYRDSWGKKITVYGSLSFSDNSIFTKTNSEQNNINLNFSSTSNTQTEESDLKKNLRFTFNLEFKPDTSNYWKFIPSFSFQGLNSNSNGFNLLSNNNQTISDYTSQTFTRSTAPNFGLSVLYNHRFNGFGRNLSVFLGSGTYHSFQYQNPINIYIAGKQGVPANQKITTTSKTDSIGANLSYIEPINRSHFIEFTYGFHTSHTKANKGTDTLNQAGSEFQDLFLSNDYQFDFTLNRMGINFKGIQKKYNYTLGIAFQPTLLTGNSPLRGITTRVITYNWAPTLRYIYNFSKNKFLSLNYNGSSNQPSFSVLQPVIDFSNASYPVQGNQNLKPEFNNNFSFRYNNFNIGTANVFFSNFSFNAVSNKIVSNSITYPKIYPINPTLAGTILTQYLNTSGYYSSSIYYQLAHPWHQRRYTLMFTGNYSFSNNISFISSVNSSTDSVSQKNINQNLVLSQTGRFRYNIDDKIDAEINSTYSINHASNSIPQENFNNNFQTLSIGINGKNYLLKDWTLSYDFTKTLYFGYIGSTNPNIFNAYLERRFLKNNLATFRLAAYDIFNQNTGYSSSQSGTSSSQTITNRLGRYYLLSFTLRLQKFAGKRPDSPEGGFGRPGRFPGGGPPDGPRN